MSGVPAPGKSRAGPVAESAADGVEVRRHGSCQEVAAAAKRTVLTISADCRTMSETEQQQQLGDLSGQNNGCFGFLKSPRR